MYTSAENEWQSRHNLLISRKNYSILKDSETVNGSVDTNNTAITKISNKNQWCYHGKVLT